MDVKAARRIFYRVCYQGDNSGPGLSQGASIPAWSGEFERLRQGSPAIQAGNGVETRLAVYATTA